MRKTFTLFGVIALVGYAFGIGWEIALMLNENIEPDEDSIGRQNVSVKRYAQLGISALEMYLKKCADLAEYESTRDTDSAPDAGT